jgi:hypothetical protein
MLGFYPAAVLHGGVASLMRGFYSIFYAIPSLLGFVWMAASVLLAVEPTISMRRGWRCHCWCSVRAGVRKFRRAGMRLDG